MARHRYSVQLRWSDMDALRHVNNVYAEARTVMVCVDLATGTAVEIDPRMREGLAAFVDDGQHADGASHVAGIVTDPITRD